MPALWQALYYARGYISEQSRQKKNSCTHGVYSLEDTVWFNRNDPGRVGTVHLSFHRAEIELNDLPKISNLVITILTAAGTAKAESALCMGLDGSNSFLSGSCLKGRCCCFCGVFLFLFFCIEVKFT